MMRKDSYLFLEKLRHKTFVFVLSVFFVSFGVRGLSAQDVNSIVEVDTNDILIGDHINLSIFLKAGKEDEISWPNYIDTITEGIDIIDKSDLDTTFESDGNIYSQQMTLTIFDSGYYFIPPIRFYYKRPGDTNRYFVESDPIPIVVNTLEVDTSKVIKDIKAPLRAPLTFKEILPWILISLAVIIVIAFVVYYLRRRKQKKPLFQIRPKPKLPPHKKALEALEKLKNEKLWQSGLDKEYQSRLTDIVRLYIEESFNVQAVEMTTGEIMQAMKNVSISDQSKQKLEEILIMADFVKFAKLKPLPLEHDQSYNNSVAFVKETMPKTYENPIAEKAESSEGGSDV